MPHALAAWEGRDDGFASRQCHGQRSLCPLQPPQAAVQACVCAHHVQSDGLDQLIADLVFKSVQHVCCAAERGQGQCLAGGLEGAVKALNILGK